jgi:hypothetical protein
MAQRMAEGPMYTDDAVYEYWLAHSSILQVNDHATMVELLNALCFWP